MNDGEMPSDSRPFDIGQVCPSDEPPEPEIISQVPPVSDPIDEIHEDPQRLTRPQQEVAKAAASPISTLPATGSEKVQEDDIPSLHTDTCDEDPISTVPGAVPASPVARDSALSTPQTPKRSMSRSRSRSRSLSPSLLSSPLTCLSSSPIREKETRQSSPESDFTDMESDCKPTKASTKRRSIGEADIRSSKKSRLETISVDFADDIKAEEQPASKPRRKAGKRSARSSPSPCPDSSPPVSMNVTATPNAADSGSTDQGLMGMVVEALAMTRASSMDVESIRKIVVVCQLCPVLSRHRFSHLIDRGLDRR
jgi:hypothetical protein